jgi:hypothetical protein
LYLPYILQFYVYTYVCYFLISTENLVVDTHADEPADAAVDGQETDSNTSSPAGSVKGDIEFFSNGGMRSSDDEDDRRDDDVPAVMSKCIFFSVLPFNVPIPIHICIYVLYSNLDFYLNIRCNIFSI